MFYERSQAPAKDPRVAAGFQESKQPKQFAGCPRGKRGDGSACFTAKAFPIGEPWNDRGCLSVVQVEGLQPEEALCTSPPTLYELRAEVPGAAARANAAGETAARFHERSKLL